MSGGLFPYHGKCCNRVTAEVKSMNAFEYIRVLVQTKNPPEPLEFLRTQGGCRTSLWEEQVKKRGPQTAAPLFCGGEGTCHCLAPSQ